MGLIHADPEFIAGTVADSERQAVAPFTPMDVVQRLRVEAAELREMVRDTNALCVRQASIIGEQRDILRSKATAAGITTLIRELKALTVEDARELILVLSNRVAKIEGFDTDWICSLLDEAHAARVPVAEVFDAREHAAAEAADWKQAEIRDGAQ